MKRGIGILLTAVFLMGGVGIAQAKPVARTTTKPVARPAVTAPAATSNYVRSETLDLTKPEGLIEAMKPGFAFSGDIDVKMFNMTNASFYTETSKWYFYPVYRAMVANVFEKKNFGVYMDVEKPGYADITYPTIKVNEMFAKFKQTNFYVKLGRQVFGDTQDLLLGVQSDAVSMGYDINNADLLFFIARVNLLKPWVDGGSDNIGSMLGFVPTFYLNENMKLKGYLLIGMEPISVTSGSSTKDSVNNLIQLGGKYNLLPVAGGFNFDGQLGLQMGMAKTNTDQSIDAFGFGLKLDAGVGAPQQGEQMGYDFGGHLVFTNGTDMSGDKPKYGFASQNSLPGSGPGMFSKIQDGAGPYTYVDGPAVPTGAGNTMSAYSATTKFNNYIGVVSFGLTGELAVGSFKPGVGFWIYSNTDKDGKSMGTEFDEWIIYKASDVVSFYQQLAFFSPSSDSFPSIPGASGNVSAKSPMKFLIGSAISF